MIRMISGFLGLVLATSFAAAQDDSTEEIPKPRRYTVEVIVFAYAEDVSVGTEIFPPDVPDIAPDELLPGDLEMGPAGIAIDADGSPIPAFTDAAGNTNEDPLDKTIEDTEPTLLAIEPVLTVADDFSMQRELERLELLDAYEPLVHTGWTQSTLPLEQSIALELPYFGKPPAGLEGGFTLYLGRYLHLVVDLTLDAPTAANEQPAAYGEPILSFGDERPHYEVGSRPAYGAVRYRIQEDRIIKNGELRYFDHPKFGVIAKVTRVEEPEEDPETGLGPGSAPLVVNPDQ